MNSAHELFPELLASSSLAWRAVATARSALPSSAGHSMVHIPLPTVTLAGETNTKKSHGLTRKPIFDFFGFSKKTKQEKSKESDTHEKIGISPHPPSKVSLRSGLAATQASSVSPPSDHADGSEKPLPSKQSFFSCCSGKYFEDGITRLAPHGFMMM